MQLIFYIFQINYNIFRLFLSSALTVSCFMYGFVFTLHFKFSARTKTSEIYSRPLRNKIYHTP